jgi:glutamate/tyrosine decarboxylase-like PLP-dependent enzyme
MPDPDARRAFLDRFAWHPEPELLGVRDEDASRRALEAAGAAAWSAALDYLYRHGFGRAMGEAVDPDATRIDYFGPSGRPGPAPIRPRPLADVLDEISVRHAPYGVSAYHPRSFGYFTPPPLVASVAGEIVAQVMQQGVDVWHAGPVAALVEEEVVRWLCDAMGYPADAFGLLTSGGVMANFIGMALARDVHLARALGRVPRGRDLEGVRVYASDQAHFSIGRALGELGFPADTLALIAADDDFRLRGAAVEAAIRRDLAVGLRPIAIAAVAGTTNTGSLDAVGELADVAGRHGLWLHVDAAYGGAIRLSARDRDRLPDLERADSITVDPHKWLFQAYDIGGLLVRRGADLGAAFGGHLPEYYAGAVGAFDGAPRAASRGPLPGSLGDDDHGDDVAAAGQVDFYRLGFEGTRRWRALKLWASWQHLGTEGFGRLIDATTDVAAHLARAIGTSDDFEALPAVPPTSVVCFRHLPGGAAAASRLAPEVLDAHQVRLQAAIEKDGRGWVTITRLRGRAWLRAGVVNTQATEADADALLDLLRELAR